MAKEKLTDEEFEALLSKYDYGFQKGDLVKGIVCGYDNAGVSVDIGAKTEAFLPNKEISNSTDKAEELKIGDVKEFYVLREETDKEDSCIVLSLRKLSCAKSWQTLQNAKLNNETIVAKVVQIVKGGVIAEAEDLRGFIPASQLRTGAPFEGMLDQEIEVKILEADPQKNKLIFSQRQAIAEQREKVVDDVIVNLEEGAVVKGEVVRIANFGAFVDINGVDGLLPISEISWQRIKHPSDVLALGDEIEVKIIKIDNELKRISLSLKRMTENPWQQIEGQFEEGQLVKGTVNKVATFGAFVNIFPGVEALLPIAEMDGENPNPFNLYKAGDEIEVLIKKFTPQEHRIALSVKDIQK